LLDNPFSMKLQTIEVEGDAYGIGRAMGEIAAPAYHDVVTRLGRFRSLQRQWAGSDRLTALQAAARQAYPEILREIEGIADGLGASFHDVFLWNCRGDFPGGGDQSQADEAGCTTIMLPGHDGGPGIIAHNEDDQAELDGHCFLVRARPRHGIGFVSFYSPGLLPGHTFGVNQEGLVQTINHIRPHDQTPGIPRHLIARAVLGAGSLDEALGILSRNDRASGFHHNLGQVGGECLLSVEAPASGCVARPISRPVAHANHLVFEEFADIHQEVAPSSASRQRRAETLLSAVAARDFDPLVALGDEAGGDLPICRKRRDGPDPGYTLATAVYAIGSEQVQWRVYPHPRAPAEHVGIERVIGEPRLHGVGRS
jgi:hypothetical protein